MQFPAFHHRAPKAHRHHFLSEADVRTVLERLPAPLWKRLAAVHFNDRSRGRRTLGYVREGMREISLCALPHRISLNSALHRNQSPAQFGAVRGCQWPRLAVRRFLLYDVFLHELGHLQVINPKAKGPRRKFAGETLAQRFADRWRRELWSRPFDHPDPVHRPPSPEELAAVRNGWKAAHDDYKTGLLHEQSRRYGTAAHFLKRAVERFPGHAMALERLGTLTYAGQGADQSTPRAIELLGAAVDADATLLDANIFLGLALARSDRQEEARRCFERALRVAPWPALVMSMYADSLADWGLFDEAEALFQKAIRKGPTLVLPVRDLGRCLLRAHELGATKSVDRAIGLLERAVALDPRDAQSHYLLGAALLDFRGAIESAVVHLKEALRIDPTHANAAEALAEAEATREDPETR